MSHFDSGSEDGQINDFLILSGGEHEEGDTDSLDIKPPQAQQRQFNRRKSSKDKKHSREHKHKDRDRARERTSTNYREKTTEKDRFTDKRHRHMIETTRDSRDIIEIRDRSDRYGYRNRENHDQQREYDYNLHRQQKTQQQQQRDYNQRMEPPLSTVRDRRKYIEHANSTDAAERALEDLRSRLLSKRNKYEKENSRYSDDIEQRYEQSVINSGGQSSSNYDQQQQHHHSSRSSSREHRSEAKRKDNIIEVIDSPEQIVDYKMKEKKIHSIDDPEQAARRTKLLEAEREMAKRKEVARKELAARRELRKEKDGEDSDSSISSVDVTSGPERKNKKQKRHHISEDYIERHHKKKLKKHESPVEEGQYDDNRPVEVSDDNYNSEYSSGEEDMDFTDDEDDSEITDSGESITSSKESPKKCTKRKKLLDNIDDTKDILPGSPLSIGDLSKSPHNTSRNSRSKSRSARSQLAHSVRSKSRSRSKSMSVDRDRYLASVSRSRSKSISPLLEDKMNKGIKEHQIHSNSNEINDIEMKNLDTQEGSNIEEKTSKNIDTSLHDEECEKLPNYYPGIQGCRSVEEFQCLNRIEEGTYGVVYRAKDKRTNEIVALKRLKMEKEKEGFPITSLREINTLLKGQHPNIVTVREIVVGSNMDKIFIVMDYVEHDLKSLMETMKHKEQSFFPGEVKCLAQQLLRAVGHLHDNWILHRDLKTSNLLLSHKGILKVGDFGLAREYGSPLKAYTSLVVTLWYRAPELLLCTKEYSTPIDLWSVGCIFAEFLQMSAMFPGKSEIDQLNRIFKELGTPNEKIWPGYKDLPAVQNSHFTEYPVSNLRRKFYNKTTEVGISLLQGMLTYDPKQRLTAEQALKHPYFKELPLPIDPSMFPTWPAKSELGARKALISSPKAPSGGSQFKQLGRDELPAPAKNPNTTNKNTGFVLNAGIEQRQLAMGPGFSLKF